MTVITEGGPTRKTLPLRVWDILSRPNTEWRVIAEETGGLRSLYIRYVLPLVLFGSICGYLGGLLFGVKMGALVFPPDPVSAAFGAGASVIMNLVAVYILALMIDVLAPSFGGEANRARAFKLAAYAATAFWVARGFALYPPIWMLGVVGLYSIYLIYAGLPVMMRTKSPRPWLYALLIAGMAMVLLMLSSLVSAGITRVNLVPKPGEASRWADRQFQFPGMDDRKRIASKLAAAEPGANGLNAAERAMPLVTGDELQTLLPMDFAGGFTRTSVANSQQKLGLVTTAQADATYAAPKSQITLQVRDIGAAGVEANRLKPHGSKETGSGYAEIGLVDGRLTTETYDRQSHTGSFSVVVSGRFAVKADGVHVVIGDLQNAVRAVDFARLEAMAKG